MEYSLEIKVMPTVREDTYEARVFIHRYDDDERASCAQVWETALMALDPSETADPRMWALILLREMVARLEPAVWDRPARAKAITMLNVFEHQEH